MKNGHLHFVIIAQNTHVQLALLLCKLFAPKTQQVFKGLKTINEFIYQGKIGKFKFILFCDIT